MPSTQNILHGIFSLGSFSAAFTSLLVSFRLGALQFIKQNFIDGLCTDVWDGFFLSPTNLLAIGFLFYLPIHCYTHHAPGTILLMSALMAIPSYLFVTATFLEISPVLLPLGLIVGPLMTLGMAQYRSYCLTSPIGTGGVKNLKQKPSVSFSPQNIITSSSYVKDKGTIIESFDLNTNSKLESIKIKSKLVNQIPPLNHNPHNHLLSSTTILPTLSNASKLEKSPISKRKRRES